MKAAIIAAGMGERFVRAGIALPKPLIPICGTPMIARIIEAAARINAASVVCIINELSPALDTYLADTTWPIPVNVIRKTTSSSLESLFQLAPALKEETFLLFTVDTIFFMTALFRFVAGSQYLSDAGGVLALTRFVDDERPLFADMGKNHRITAIGDASLRRSYATAGIYCFRSQVFEHQAEAEARKLGSLREFLAYLVEQDYPLYGIRVSKTIDVDRPEDVVTAESYTRSIP